WMLLPSALLAVTCLLVGIFPARTIGPFLGRAAQGLLGDEVPKYSLVVWHGFTLPLVMSLIALAGGALLYLLLHRYRDGSLAPAPLSRPIDGKRSFDVIMVVIMRSADRLLNTLSTRRLQPQLGLMVLAAVAITTFTIWRQD